MLFSENPWSLDSAWRVSHRTSLTVTLCRPWGAQVPLGEQNATLLEALLFHGHVTSLRFLSLSELHFPHLRSRVRDTVLASVRPASVWSLMFIPPHGEPGAAGGCWPRPSLISGGRVLAFPAGACG